MASVSSSEIGGTKINLGNGIKVYVNGEKVEGVFALRLCASDGGQVQIERYKEKDGARPYYDKASNSLPTEKLIFPAVQVDLEDAGVKIYAEPS